MDVVDRWGWTETLGYYPDRDGDEICVVTVGGPDQDGDLPVYCSEHGLLAYAWRATQMSRARLATNLCLIEDLHREDLHREDAGIGIKKGRDSYYITRQTLLDNGWKNHQTLLDNGWKNHGQW